MEKASLLRRLAAMTYDLFIIIACIIFSTLIWVIVKNEAVAANNVIVFRTYILAVIYLFFVWFWVKRGQTLGMLAWKMKLVGSDGNKVGVIRASFRFILALLFSIPCGFTYIWMILDPESVTLHDRISKTYVVKTI